MEGTRFAAATGWTGAQAPTPSIAFRSGESCAPNTARRGAASVSLPRLLPWAPRTLSASLSVTAPSVMASSGFPVVDLAEGIPLDLLDHLSTLASNGSKCALNDLEV